MGSENKKDAINTIHDDSELKLWKSDNSNSEKESSRYSKIDLVSSCDNKITYSAYDNKFKRSVTLVESIGDNQNQLDFINEIIITTSLNHPNTLQILDFGTWKEGKPYFTIQQSDNKPLKDYIRSADSSEIKNLEIFKKICGLISHAHALNLSHEKLSTDNIFLAPNGEVIVTEWAQNIKLSEPKTTETKELNEGSNSDTSKNADGEATLDASSDIAKLGSILKNLYSKDRNTPPSDAISSIISKTSSDNAENRYQNINDLEGDIEKFLKSRNIEPQESGFFKGFTKFYQENQSACSFLLMIFAILVGVAIYSFIDINNKKQSLTQSLDQVKKESRKLKQQLKKEAKINDLFLKSELKRAKKLMSGPLYFNSPQESSKQAVDIYLSQKDPKKHHKDLFMALMIRQDFQSILKQKIKAPGPLMRIAKICAKKEKGENGLLQEDKDFNHLFTLVNKLAFEHQDFKQEFAERAISYRNAVTQESAVPVHVLKSLIQAWNPDWLLKDLYYNPENMNLRLKGEAVSILKVESPYSSGQSFLHLLNINNLDMRQAGVASLTQLDGLNIQRLDIRATPIQEFPTHDEALKVNTLVITPGQFGNEQVKQVPASTNITQIK